MALTRLVTPYAKRRHVASAPLAVRLTVLRAVNAPLANELEAVEAEPSSALSRMKKLDAETAVELVGLITSREALRAALGDRRDSVSGAVQVRASMLSFNLAHTDPSVAPTKQVGVSTETRTAKVLAKPTDEAIAALAKMATLDESAVLNWTKTLDRTTPWDKLVAATNRHWGLAESIIKDALIREVVDIPAYLTSGDLHVIVTAAQNHEGELNASMILVLDQAIAREHPFNEINASGLSDAAFDALATASLDLRMICNVATAEEAVAGFYQPPAVQARRQDVHENLRRLYANVRSADIADALTPLIAEAKAPLGYPGMRFANAAAQHLLTIPGIKHSTVRELWAHIDSAMSAVLSGDCGPQPSDDDITWLIERYGDAADERFDVSSLLSAIGYATRTEASAAFTNRILFEMPGGAAALLNTNQRWRDDWLSSTLFEHATEKLQHNVAAWRIFLSEVDGYDGLFEDLLHAAVIATA